MSDFISSSLLIISIVILRAIFGNYISQRLKYVIWLIVVIKLLIPIPSFSHNISVMDYVESTPVYIEKIKPIENQKTLVISNNDYHKNEISIEFIKKLGSCVILFVYVISYIVFYVRLKKDRQFLYKDTICIYQSQIISSPCLFGIIPAIYITNDTNNRYVITHEKMHFKHLDFIWVFVRILCIVLFWYNPFVYLAAYLSKIDCELACDEATIRCLGEENRKQYGKVLLDIISKRNRQFYSMSIKGGHKEMKKRINMIIKKPKKYVLNGVICMMCLMLIFVWTLSSKTQNISQLNSHEDYLSTVKDIMPEFISEHLQYVNEDKDNNILSLSNVKGNPVDQANLQFDIYKNKDYIYCFRCTTDMFIIAQSVDNRINEVNAKEIIEKFADKLLKKTVQLTLDKTLTDETSFVFLDQEKDYYRVNKFYGYIEEYNKHNQREVLTESQKEEFLYKCQETMPQAIMDEINKNGYIYYTFADTYTVSIANAKEEPTLRLDFSYDGDNHLCQYVSKEYGFVDTVIYDDILYQDAYYENIVKKFGKVFLNQQIEIEQTDLPSHYSGSNNMRAYKDKDGGIYVLNLGVQLIVFYESGQIN